MRYRAPRTPRRNFLRASGVDLALPLLNAFLPRSAAAVEESIPQRLVCICTSLGLHTPFLFPEQAGRDYEPTPYLKLLDGRHPFGQNPLMARPDWRIRTHAAHQQGASAIGRDHWTQCYSAMLADAGIKGRMVYGASDDTAA